ncbi:hypothetical protein CHUAL_003215 [Chamberlinius hualienensis]
MADKKDGHARSKESRSNHNSSHDGCEEDTSLSGGEPSSEHEKSAKRSKRRASSPNLEPRSSKRLRLQYQPFQSPTLHIPQLRPTKSSEEKEVVYVKGEFLALRNESGSFYICQAAQNVYKSSRRFRIRWLSKADGKEPNVYSRDFYDYTDFECVLTNIQMDRLDKNLFRLPREESLRTEGILKKALNLENGIYKVEPDSNEIHEEESSNHKGSSSKDGSKQSVLSRRSNVDSSKGSNTRVDISSKKYQVAKVVENRAPSQKREERSITTRTKRNSLPISAVAVSPEKPKLNTKVTLYSKDPTFESNNPIPYVSIMANSRLLIRSVLMNDVKSLQNILKDRVSKCWYGVHQSIDQPIDALCYALLKENHAAIEILLNERKNPAKSAIKMTETTLLHHCVGKSNFKFLGSAVREISLSRGAREGNGALIKDSYEELTDLDYINLMLKHGVSAEVVDLFCANSLSHETMKKLVISNFYRAVSYGHRKLAARLIDDALKLDALGFTVLHKEVLQFEKQDLSTFRPESVTKRSFGNCGIAPIHCAAINPVSKYLKQLIDANPDFNIADHNSRKPIHYAAACDGPCPMDLLLSRNVKTDEVDNDGNSPLHMASESGRVHNVELLLKRARTDKRSGDDKFLIHQGLGGINRANRDTYTPLHLACIQGHLDVVKSLVKYGADMEKPTGLGKNKATPLMLVCQHGHLEMLKFLVNSGAKLDARDKLKRTAMTYAVMNGHAHIASHLLRMGCDPSTADSSGNSLLHYAVAYGWWFCIKLLLDAGAILNCCNDWMITPLGIAFLKGHIGLAESLLHQSNIDLEFKDDNGLSYVMLAACSPLIPALVDTFRYLIVNKKAKCTDIDIHGNTPLHWLACNSTLIEDKQGKVVCDEAVQTSLQMAKILLENDCDPTARNHKGQTVLTLAIQQGNNELVKLLLNDGSQVTAEVDDTGENLLHALVDHSWENDLSSLIQVIKENPGKKAKTVNGEDSFELNLQNPPTPLLENVDGVLKVGDLVVMKGVINATSTTFSTSLLQGFDVEKDDVALNCVVKLTGTDVNLTCNGRVNGKWKDAKEIPLPILPSTGDNKDKNVDIELAITLQDEQFQVSVGGSAYIDFPVSVSPKHVVCLHVTKDSRLNSVQIQRSAITKTSMPAISLPSDVLREMAQTYSYDGFTPLLLACNKYQYTNDAKQQACLRKIIKTLIDDSDSEVHAVVKKRSDNKSRNIDGYSALHFLASAGEVPDMVDGVEVPVPGLSLLLNYKPPINIQDHRGRTPLVTAILRRQTAAAEALINADANVNLCSGDMEDDGRASPLILAANLGLISVIKLLLKNGANVQMADEKNHSTALHYAVLMKSSPNALDVVRCLLEAGINVNSTNQDGRTPLHLGVNANGGSTDDTIDIEDLLIEKGADLFAKDSLGRLPLHYAFVKIGRPDDSSKIDPIEIVSLLTEAMKGSNLDVADHFGQTPLHRAALRGATISCMHLTQSITNLNAKDKNGNTALSLAVYGSHESCTIMLLQKGASVQVDVIVPPLESRKHDKVKKPIWQWKPVAEVPAQLKKTPILQEVVHKDWQGVMYMMVGQLQSSGATFFPAIEAALKTGKYKLALYLIARNKSAEAVNTFNSNEQNLLHILASIPQCIGCSDLQVKVAKVLLSYGLSLNRPDADGGFPLTYAALNKNEILCEFFTEQLGWDSVVKMAPDKLGRTPLTSVFWSLEPFEWRTPKLKAMRSWCEKLLSHGASCNILGAFPYFDNCPGDTFIHVSRHVDCKSLESCRISPLIYAVYLRDYELVAFLLQHSADVNLPDDSGRTPIMHAVKTNDIGMVKLLLNLTYPYKEDVYSSLEKRRLHKLLYFKNLETVLSSSTKTSVKENALKTHNDIGKEEETNKLLVENDEKDLVPSQECDRKINCDNLGKLHDNAIDVEGVKAEVVEKPMDLEIDKNEDMKSSKVSLSQTDGHGWTVIHHLIRPFSCGTYDNADILHLLAEAGAPLDISNTAGFSPLQMAVQGRAHQLALALQKLLDCSTPSITTSVTDKTSKDGIQWDREMWDYKVDAAEVLERVESEAMEEGEDDVVISPDVHSGLEDTGEVVVDSEQNISYDAFMTKVELSGTGAVCYNFFKMQVINQPGKNLFILFSRWGKLGCEGEYQQIPHSSLDDATKEFCRIFKGRSGNNWQDIKNFQPVAKKYRVIEALRRGRRKLRDISLNLVKDAPSALSPQLQDLMNTLTNVLMLQEACRDIGLDTSVMPFGRLCEAALQRGRQILRELKNIITEKMKIDNEPKYRDRVIELAEKIIDLSSEYFQAIPQHGYAFEKVRPLENLQGVKNYLENLEYMFHLELVSKLLLGAQLRVKEINPLDYAYRSMDCQLCAMQETDAETQYILQYIHNTSLSPKPAVECIYRVSRKEELSRQSSTTETPKNKWLLWHGIPAAKVISVLTKGLGSPGDQDASKAAQDDMFKEIRLVDSFEMSRRMCQKYSKQTTNTQFALLCEVVLGKNIDSIASHCIATENGYESFSLAGTYFPDPSCTLILTGGVKIPLGTLTCKYNNDGHIIPGQTDFNEYMVTNREQIFIRYLVCYRSDHIQPSYKACKVPTHS